MGWGGSCMIVTSLIVADLNYVFNVMNGFSVMMDEEPASSATTTDTKKDQ